MFVAGDGPATGDLAEAAFLLTTGWTHSEYEAAPDTVVAAMLAIMNARAELSRENGGG